MEVSAKKRILSGIQPTGTFTLGNYIGAVRNWGLLQQEYECLYMVANMHASTVRQTPADLRRQTREAAALLLACASTPKKAFYLYKAMYLPMQSWHGYLPAIPNLASFLA